MESLAGRRFGKLVVVAADQQHYGELMWQCRCDCGWEVCVRESMLRRGRETSCGQCETPPVKPSAVSLGEKVLRFVR